MSKYLRKSTPERKDGLWLMISEFQPMVAWPLHLGPLARQSIVAWGTWWRKDAHFRAAGKQKGARTKYSPQGYTLKYTVPLQPLPASYRFHRLP